MAEMDMGLSPQNGNKKKKKRKKENIFKSIVTGLIPWKGDSVTEIFRKVIFLASLLIMMFAVVLIANHFITTLGDGGDIDSVVVKGEDGTETTIIELKNQAPTKEQIAQMPEGSVNEEFAALYAANNEFVGWISIDGTNINYPVMQTADADNFVPCKTYDSLGYCSFCQEIMDKPYLAKQFYLHHDFDRNYLFDGNIFADYEGSFGPSEMPNNTILYGHNMLYKHQFAALSNYKVTDFLKLSPVVDFSTLYQDNKYKIFSVFLVPTTEEYGEIFDYHNQVYFENSAEFYDYVLECMDRSLYETGVDIEYGDEFLTLSTCDESTGFNDMRLVIVARKVRQNESPEVDTEKIARKDSVKYFDAYYSAYGNKWKGRTWDVSLVKGMAEYLKENGLEDPAE